MYANTDMVRYEVLTTRVLILLPSRMLSHEIWQILTDVSKDLTTFITNAIALRISKYHFTGLEDYFSFTATYLQAL